MQRWGIVNIILYLGFTGVSFGKDIFLENMCGFVMLQSASANVTQGEICLPNEFSEVDYKISNGLFADERHMAEAVGNSTSDSTLLQIAVYDIPDQLKKYVFRSELIQQATQPFVRISFSGIVGIIFELAIPITPEGKFDISPNAVPEGLYLEALEKGLLFGYQKNQEILFLIIHLSGDVEVLANSFMRSIHFENEGALCIYNPTQFELGNWSIQDGKTATCNCSSLSRNPQETIKEKQLRFCGLEDMVREEKLNKMKNMFAPDAFIGQ